ncbi:hypothetical protein QF032_005517 [Streptomyces achromogenes]|nr:hypothetical protein [Streptomyces achromogenes]
MWDDTTRMLVNRAQFDNSNETRDRIWERTPAVRAIEHTIEYLDLVGSCHGFVATLGRLVPPLRGQEFTEDERETVRRQIGRVRAAADWLEEPSTTAGSPWTSSWSSCSKASRPCRDAGRPGPWPSTTAASSASP